MDRNKSRGGLSHEKIIEKNHRRYHGIDHSDHLRTADLPDRIHTDRKRSSNSSEHQKDLVTQRKNKKTEAEKCFRKNQVELQQEKHRNRLSKRHGKSKKSR